VQLPGMATLGLRLDDAAPTKAEPASLTT
jgi:hypothetical protein